MAKNNIQSQLSRFLKDALLAGAISISPSVVDAAATKSANSESVGDKTQDIAKQIADSLQTFGPSQVPLSSVITPNFEDSADNDIIDDTTSKSRVTPRRPIRSQQGPPPLPPDDTATPPVPPPFNGFGDAPTDQEDEPDQKKKNPNTSPEGKNQTQAGASSVVAQKEAAHKVALQRQRNEEIRANQLNNAQIQNQQNQAQNQNENNKNEAVNKAEKKLKWWKRCSCLMSAGTVGSGCILLPFKCVMWIVIYFKKKNVKNMKKESTAPQKPASTKK